MKGILCALFIMPLFIALTGCGVPRVYSAKPIQAWVIDADTKQPIPGVVVTANWQLEKGSLAGHTTPPGQLMVMEAVTDKDGRFFFPAWGPKLTFKGHLEYRDPQLLLFKPGYDYLALTNPFASWQNSASVRTSRWDGKRIEMKRFSGKLEEYKDKFESFNRELENIALQEPQDCNWQKIPEVIRAVHRERIRLIAQGVNPYTFYTVDYELLLNDQYYTKKGNCGSPKNFFGRFQQ